MLSDFISRLPYSYAYLFSLPDSHSLRIPPPSFYFACWTKWTLERYFFKYNIKVTLLSPWLFAVWSNPFSILSCTVTGSVQFKHIPRLCWKNCQFINIGSAVKEENYTKLNAPPHCFSCVLLCLYAVNDSRHLIHWVARKTLPNKKRKSWLMLSGAEQKEIGSSAVGLEILSARLGIKSETAVEEEIVWRQRRMGGWWRVCRDEGLWRWGGDAILDTHH